MGTLLRALLLASVLSGCGGDIEDCPRGTAWCPCRDEGELCDPGLACVSDGVSETCVDVSPVDGDGDGDDG